MKEQLINILNGLNMVSTQGQSLMILANCMTQLAQIIDSLPDEKSEDVKEDK
jgi:hypothetical protein